MPGSYRRNGGEQSGMKWGTYSRISEDPHDTQRGVNRQRDDTSKAVESAGGEIVKEYVENDTSAYRKKRIERTDDLGNRYYVYRTVRPVWQEALADLRSGFISGLMVWDLDRLARDPRDLEDAIEVVEHHGARIEGESGSIDLTTDGGRAMARVLMALNNKSSADTGRRVARAALDAAHRGTAAGKRSFGWNDDKATLDPNEARLARSAVDDLIRGARTPTRIAADWNEGGVLTAHYGNPWRASTLRQYLKNPRLVGYRTHKREILRNEDGEPVKGIWEPLLDPETWEQLQVALGNRSPRSEGRHRVPHRNARHYLLTGLIRCGICGALMYGNRDGRRETHYYRCNAVRHGDGKHTLSVAGPATDSLVTTIATRRLDRVESVEMPAGEFSGDHRMGVLDGKIRELMAAFNRDEMPGGIVFPAVKDLEAELSQVRADRGVWIAQRSGPRIEELSELFESPEVGVRRGALEQLFDAILVKPPSGTARKFDIDRLEAVWKDATK